MFLVSRDGAEDVYALSASYRLVDDDLLFFTEDGTENGRVIGFGQDAGNAVVYVGDKVDEAEDE